MTTILTRQQLAAKLTGLCCVSFVIGFMLFFGFYDWLRGNRFYWVDSAVVIVLAGTLVFAFRRLLNSIQPGASPR